MADTQAPGTIQAIQRGERFPEMIYAHSAVVRFPSEVESGNWQTIPDDETKEYVRADILTATEAERDALKRLLGEALSKIETQISSAETYNSAIAKIIQVTLAKLEKEKTDND